MPRVRTTRQAEADLLNIWLYVARDDPAAADRLFDRLNSAAPLLRVIPDSARLDPISQRKRAVWSRETILSSIELSQEA